MATMTLRVRSAVLAALLFSAVAPLLVLAQEARSIPTPRTSEELAGVCQKAKNLAASQARPDVENTVEDNTGGILTDTCVAAILNPTLWSPNPTNPQSYICVGKRARIGVNSLGLITNLNAPDPSVSAGTCATTACTDYSSLGASCIAASQQTSLMSEAMKFIDSIRSFLGLPTGGGQAVPFPTGIRG